MTVVAEPGELTITELDESWALPCDVGRHSEPCAGCGGKHTPCERQADWVAWAVHCCDLRHTSVLLCDPHRVWLAESTSQAVCPGCGTQFSPALKAYTAIEPLNG